MAPETVVAVKLFVTLSTHEEKGATLIGTACSAIAGATSRTVAVMRRHMALQRLLVDELHLAEGALEELLLLPVGGSGRSGVSQ